MDLDNILKEIDRKTTSNLNRVGSKINFKVDFSIEEVKRIDEFAKKNYIKRGTAVRMIFSFFVNSQKKD